MKIEKKCLIGLSLLISTPSFALSSLEAVIERSEWAYKCGYISDEQAKKVFGFDHIQYSMTYPRFISEDYRNYRTKFRLDLNAPIKRDAPCNPEHFNSNQVDMKILFIHPKKCAKLRHKALKQDKITEDEYIELINSQTSFNNLDELTPVHCPSTYLEELEIYGTGNPRAGLDKLHQLANSGQMEASYVLATSYNERLRDRNGNIVPSRYKVDGDDILKWYGQAALKGNAYCSDVFSMRLGYRDTPGYTSLFSSVGRMTLPSIRITLDSLGTR